jgi:hypothetical protein
MEEGWQRREGMKAGCKPWAVSGGRVIPRGWPSCIIWQMTNDTRTDRYRIMYSVCTVTRWWPSGGYTEELFCLRQELGLSGRFTVPLHLRDVLTSLCPLSLGAVNIPELLALFLVATSFICGDIPWKWSQWSRCTSSVMQVAEILWWVQ